MGRSPPRSRCGSSMSSAANGLTHLGQIGRRERLVTRSDRHAEQTVQSLVSPLLVRVQMARRVVGDGVSPPPVPVHTQCCLLGHGAARNEQGGLLAEKGGDFGFEILDDAAEPVVVHLGIGGDCGEQIVRSPATMSRQKASTGLGDRFGLVVAPYRRRAVTRRGRGLLSGEAFTELTLRTSTAPRAIDPDLWLSFARPLEVPPLSRPREAGQARPRAPLR